MYEYSDNNNSDVDKNTLNIDINKDENNKQQRKFN